VDLEPGGAEAPAGGGADGPLLGGGGVEELRASFAFPTVETEVVAKEGGALQEVGVARPAGEEKGVRCLVYQASAGAVPAEALGAAVGLVVIEVTHNTSSGFYLNVSLF
jgi:hypothetical protein